MISFSEAHRRPGGIIKYLFDKVIALEPGTMKISEEISLSATAEGSPMITGMWEHGMGSAPDIALVAPVSVSNTADFSILIVDINPLQVQYAYKSKANAKIKILAIKENKQMK